MPTRPEIYIVTIRVRSITGAPDVRTLMGDTVFVRMDEGQSATWKLQKLSQDGKRLMRVRVRAGDKQRQNRPDTEEQTDDRQD